MKAMRNKKEMWVRISTEIEGRTAKQCEDRYKTLIKRKKTAVENNHTSGAKRQRIEFAQELETIAAIDDSIEPEVQMSSQAVVTKSVDVPTTSKNVAKRKLVSVQETLISISREKEERRHRERMEALNNIQELISNFLHGNVIEEEQI
ncbi:uncharacterized protein LOC118736459 [Rhagoletis pomonella]|uniref:uncharacterized protein LOC118736459 n=1 Tax=Rhagoletis pomonella TaxID=28610 RepID=UPI0017838E96|nr:uncharacterized protein LOC118736459 [Rhagoletis pomonella]